MKRASKVFAACSVPATISRGALSPPIASIAMRGVSALNRDHEIGRRLTAVVRLDGHRRIRLVYDGRDILGILELAAAAVVDRRKAPVTRGGGRDHRDGDRRRVRSRDERVGSSI